MLLCNNYLRLATKITEKNVHPMKYSINTQTESNDRIKKTNVCVPG